MKARLKVSAIYFPELKEVEATWEDIETGEKAAVTFKVTKEDGEAISKTVMPCSYHNATT